MSELNNESIELKVCSFQPTEQIAANKGNESDKVKYTKALKEKYFGQTYVVTL